MEAAMPLAPPEGGGLSRHDPDRPPGDTSLARLCLDHRRLLLPRIAIYLDDFCAQVSRGVEPGDGTTRNMPGGRGR